jgi:hypothetical protein
MQDKMCIRSARSLAPFAAGLMLLLPASAEAGVMETVNSTSGHVVVGAFDSSLGIMTLPINGEVPTSFG